MISYKEEMFVTESELCPGFNKGGALADQLRAAVAYFSSEHFGSLY